MRLEAADTTFTGPPTACLAQVRAHGQAVPAHARRDGDTLRVELQAPVRGVARGQAVVLYAPEPAGDRVLGGGWICATGG
jgi:tRNA-specific 2-thiouridylase